MKKSGGLIDRLVEAGAADRAVLEKVAHDPEYQDESLEQALLQSRVVDEVALARAISEEHGVPLISVVPEDLDEQVARLIPEEMARNHTMLPVSLEGEVLTLAMVDPVDVAAEDLVRYVTRKEVRRAVAPRAEILAGIEALYSDQASVESIMARIPKSDLEYLAEEEEVDDGEDIARSAPIIQLVNTILCDAIRMRASDIHVEPLENTLRVRYRIDGILREILTLPRRIINPVLSRLKLMALMDIAERRIPQDGRIRVLLKDQAVDLRVNTLPAYHGEKIVLRILDSSQATPRLEDLGFLPEDLAQFRRLLNSPQGMLVITGPTGSGKTTTLYAALSEVNHMADNLITVEDPVEFQLEGITQVPIRPKAGMTFSLALRAILRQDPDIVMVGEIRDPETAEIALQAAQTGHLVLSTLHTNDAASSVTRLLHMGLPGYLVGSSMLGVVAQRLARKLCQHCKAESTPSPESLALLDLMPTSRKPARFFAGGGCEDCDFSGFRGRVGLYEVLEITDRLRGLILQNANARAIRRCAQEEGMRLMIEDGLTKIEQGLTHLDEVLRVVQIESAGGRTCRECERPLAEEFLVCPYCDPGTSRFCPMCGKGLDPSWVTCPYCRSALEAPPLPRTPPSAPEPKPPVRIVRHSPAVESAGDEILVLERDPVQARILRTVLANRGHTVILVTEPDQVLERALGRRPRAIIADARLATGESNLIGRLREQLVTSFIPLILLTARDPATGSLIGVEVGADAYVLRPVEPGVLTARLRQLLDAPEQSGRSDEDRPEP